MRILSMCVIMSCVSQFPKLPFGVILLLSGFNERTPKPCLCGTLDAFKPDMV